MSRPSARAAAAWLLAGAVGVAGAQPALPPTQNIVEAPQPAVTDGAPAVAPAWSLVLQFEPHSARVRPASGPLLGSLVAALLAPELRNRRFVIEGHGEPGASAQASQLLSQQRADEVRLYLVALGVPASRLRAVGRGGAEAVAGSGAPPAPNGHIRVVALD